MMFNSQMIPIIIICQSHTVFSFCIIVSLTEKRSAVEKFELQKRCREEESLTIQEMITWLQYYKKKRDKLSEYIQELQCDSFPSCLCKVRNSKYFLQFRSSKHSTHLNVFN